MHARSVREVLVAVDGAEEGLTSTEAAHRLEIHGENTLLKTKKDKTAVGIFIEQWGNPLILILCAAGIISLFLGEKLDAYIILGTALINAIIGFIQENKANRAFENLRSMVQFESMVLRDGRRISVPSEKLVVGDTIFVSAGDKISADARIIKENRLKVNESALTGESEPVRKQVKTVAEEAGIGDRKSMLYRGTIVMEGDGYAVVTAIGSHTEIGRISQLVEKTTDDATPLQTQLRVLSRHITMIISILIMVVLLLGYVRNHGEDTLLHLFQVSIALAVAAIPEGLLISLTVVLAIGMQRILKRKSLVRKLVAAETLGSVSVICADKTGTLTEGTMRVEQIWFPGSTVPDKVDEIINQRVTNSGLSNAILMGVLGNNTAVVEHLRKDKSDEWKILGESTDAALVRLSEELGIDTGTVRTTYGEVRTVQFSSEWMYSASLRQSDEQYILAVKGAPEVILNLSNRVAIDGSEIFLDDAKREEISAMQHQLSMAGYRVVSVARKTVHSIPRSLKREVNELIYLGMFALRDPVRQDVKNTVEIAKRAGVRTIMITGDHADTALSIARDIGIAEDKSEVMQGQELDRLSLVDLKSSFDKVQVFARVEPKHKVTIVEALQSLGQIVAMTGDGVNDAPALKKSDIGVALGSGTDVAKETADMVLLDDSISTIVSAIEEGRRIYANIKKITLYLVSGSFSEVVTVLFAIFLGLPMPIVPAQILWINIVEDTFINTSLAFEKGDKHTMDRPPRQKKDRIVDQHMLIMTFARSFLANMSTFSVFVYTYLVLGDLSLARTLVLVGLGINSLFFIFSVRSLRHMIWRINPFSNRVLLGTVVYGWMMLISAVYFPPFATILETVPLNLEHWLMMIGFGIVNLGIVEAVKAVYIEKR